MHAGPSWVAILYQLPTTPSSIEDEAIALITSTGGFATNRGRERFGSDDNCSHYVQNFDDSAIERGILFAMTLLCIRTIVNIHNLQALQD